MQTIIFRQFATRVTLQIRRYDGPQYDGPTRQFTPPWQYEAAPWQPYDTHYHS